MSSVILFSGVRFYKDETGAWTDPANFLRLNLLVSSYRELTIVGVQSASRGLDWVQVPDYVEVVLGQNEIKPRGGGYSSLYALKFVRSAFSCLFEGVKQVKSANLVIVIYLLEPSVILGLFATLICRKPFVAVINGSAEEGYKVRAQNSVGVQKIILNFLLTIVRKITKVLVSQSDLLLVTGPKLRDLLGKGYSFSTSRLFESDISGNHPCLFKPGIGYTWAYSGTISYNKGSDTLLHALKKARNQGIDVELILMGRIDPGFPYDFFLDSLELQRHVRYLGVLGWEQLKEQLQGIDTYIFPSLHEGLPKAPLEAMSQGIPVISTATGAEQYVVHRKNGLLVPVSDPAAIVDGFVEIVSNLDFRVSLVSNGLNTARELTYEKSLRDVTKLVVGRYQALCYSNPVSWLSLKQEL